MGFIWRIFCFSMLISLLDLYIQVNCEDSDFDECDFEEMLDESLRDLDSVGGLIGGKFKVKITDKVEKGSIGCVYEGNLIHEGIGPKGLKVAMKFADAKKKRDEMDKEYEIYTYLKAINNSTVELYGIPTIYYYGRWEEYVVLVMTHLDDDAIDAVEKGHLTDRVNGLLMLRDFILASKYMASCGVRQDDIKPENIMVNYKKGRWFLIDFNLSAKMIEESHHGTYAYLSRRAHKFEQRGPIDEWESFLYAFCYLHRIHLPWMFNFTLLSMDDCEREEAISEYKEDTKAVMEKLNSIELGPFADSLMHFARVALELKEEIIPSIDEDDDFSDNESIIFNYDGNVPDYDKMYDFIMEQIHKMLGSTDPPIPTWYKMEEKSNVLEELKKRPDIRSIEVPSTFKEFGYPNVDYEFFTKGGKRNSSIRPSQNSQEILKKRRRSLENEQFQNLIQIEGPSEHEPLKRDTQISFNETVLDTQKPKLNFVTQSESKSQLELQPKSQPESPKESESGAKNQQPHLSRKISKHKQDALVINCGNRKESPHDSVNTIYPKPQKSF